MQQLTQVIAIDYGEKRVGVAIGNTLTRSAEPLTTLANNNRQELLISLKALIDEWQVRQIVVGMPYNPESRIVADNVAITANDQGVKNMRSERKLEQKIRKFALQLGDLVDLPIQFVDESFSSHEASRQMISNRQTGKRKRSIRKADIDRAAATILLKRWFTENIF